MGNDLIVYRRPATDRLHPWVYGAVIGLACWLVVAVWSFGGDGFTDYLLAIVSGFIGIFIAIPCALWRAGRKARSERTDANSRQSFRDWASGEFELWQDRCSARNAAVEIVLPIAALAIGMSAFGTVLVLTADGTL